MDMEFLTIMVITICITVYNCLNSYWKYKYKDSDDGK